MKHYTQQTKIWLIGEVFRIYLAGCLLAGLSGETVLAQPSGLDYQVRMTGEMDPDLRSKLESISNTAALRNNHPPFNAALLRRRALEDIPRLLRVLKAEGYYGARVHADVDTQASPAVVIFSVDIGPPFLLKAVNIETVGGGKGSEKLFPDPAMVGFRSGDTAKAKAIMDGRDRLLNHLQLQGYPYPAVLEQEVVVDHACRCVTITFVVEPGTKARFGNTEITGLTSVDEEFVRSLLSWKQGEIFRIDLLLETHKRLSATGLFTVVRVVPGNVPYDGDLLPIIISLTERKHRSVGAGISYKTDEGPGAKVSWEHRNLFHGAQRLSVAAAASDFTSSAEATFRKPNFRRPDQFLLVNVRLAKDTPDSYTSESARGSSLVGRALNDEITAAAGLGVKISEIEQLDETDSFSLFYIPANVDWDSSNDPLDPTEGGRVTLQAAPYYDMEEKDYAFLKGYGNWTGYTEILNGSDVVAAARLAAGTVAGASTAAVPADERFYAGGGGSVRGYAFQSVGPLDGETPLGGRSLLEMSLECRFRVTDRLGLVAFLDGGTAFSGNQFETDEDIRWGTGIGLRYFTPVGPIRLDVGCPLNRRAHMDDPFQIYVSLGQSF